MTRSRVSLVTLVAVLAVATLAGCTAAPDDAPNGSGAGNYVAHDAGTVQVDGATYVPENDTVRYVGLVGRNHTGYRYVPFEEFADLQCPPAVQDHVVETVENRVDDTVEFGHGVTDDAVRIYVYHSSPVGADAVRAALPPGYDVELTLFGRTHTCRVDVVVEETARPEPV